MKILDIDNNKVVMEFGANANLDEIVDSLLSSIDENGNKVYLNAENFIIDLGNKKLSITEYFMDKVKNQIEKRATEYVKKQLDELDYDNEGEVALYAANPESEWNAESKALQAWIEAVYKKMYELQNSVSVDNYKEINLNEIEANYPKFEYQG